MKNSSPNNCKSNIVSEKTFLASIVLNAILVILGIIGLTITIGQQGAELFSKYTNLSNMLSLLFSLLYLIFGIIAFAKKRFEIPKIILLFRFLAVVSLMVTFFVVMAGFISGWGVDSFSWAFIDNSALEFHLICPILSLISFLFFETTMRLKFRHILFSSLLTYVYTVISVTLNILKIWHGPYPFLYVYEQPFLMSVLWVVVINGGSMLIGFLILIIKNRRLS